MNGFFKKEDIKAGYLLEFNSGNLAIVTYNHEDELCYSAEHKWGNVNDLSDELCQCGDSDPRVIAIYGRTYNADAYKIRKQGRNCLWKYEEPKLKLTLKQIEELVGHPVEIVDEL